MIKSTPVLVFSKTYCPYCDEAKNILRRGNVEFVAQELDVMNEGSAIQNALEDITGQRTVPNIFIAGNHVGGCSDLKAKVKSGIVPQMLSENQIPNSF
jgi:glutaredoxin 3